MDEESRPYAGTGAARSGGGKGIVIIYKATNVNAMLKGAGARGGNGGGGEVMLMAYSNAPISVSGGARPSVHDEVRDWVAYDRVGAPYGYMRRDMQRWVAEQAEPI